MTMTYRLHFAPDNASLIVRIALEELGVAYETALVDRSVRAQDTQAFRRINPNGLIPALETPDGTLFETGAILLWLADRNPGKLGPLPDQVERSGFLKWLFFLSNTLHTSQRMSVHPHRYVGEDLTAQSKMRTHLQNEISLHLDTLNAASAGTWFLGPSMSMIDIYLACLVRWIALYPAGTKPWFNLENWPKLHANCVRLEQQASTQTAQKSEGLGPNPFTAPIYANPPEGSIT